jgi:hypothetical protein
MVLPLLTALYISHILPLATLGYALIPLRTKGTRQVWKQFQTQRPTPAQLQRWFKNSTYSAYGVLCGQISNLMVLDFDQILSYEAFIARFPHLADTFYYHAPLQDLPFVVGDMKRQIPLGEAKSRETAYC